jgi:DNA (cytosine-5)-methyltransferase 1
MKFLNQCNVVDLFCGVGGLAHGFVLEGFTVVAGVDFDKSCKFAFEENNNAQFINEDLNNIDSNIIKNLYPEKSIKILVGCAPCQPFSRYTSGLKPRNEDDKWSLLRSFAKIIESVQPDIVSMENVPQLAKYDKKGVYKEFISVLEKNNYFVSDSDKIVSCSEYGVPQKRKRLVLLASKLGEIDLIPPIYTKENAPTVRQAIGWLPKIEDGDVYDSDPFHRSQKLSDLNKKRIQSTKQGGSWRDWSDDLKLKCHKKLSGRTFGDVYGRMVWDDQAPTLTTHCTGLGNGRFGHPEQDRAISLREASILQSFPPNYKFSKPEKGGVTYTQLQRHIGNAVPVELGRAIAESIKIHLQKHTEY